VRGQFITASSIREVDVLIVIGIEGNGEHSRKSDNVNNQNDVSLSTAKPFINARALNAKY
jgi:hypothetical protein